MGTWQDQNVALGHATYCFDYSLKVPCGISLWINSYVHIHCSHQHTFCALSEHLKLYKQLIWFKRDPHLRGLTVYTQIAWHNLNLYWILMNSVSVYSKTVFSFWQIDPFVRVFCLFAVERILKFFFFQQDGCFSSSQTFFFIYLDIFNPAFVCACLCVSLPEVFGEDGCVPGAGRGPRGDSSSGQPTHRLCVTAAEEPSCSLAAHHHYHHHGLLSALWPQRCKLQIIIIIFHFFQIFTKILFFMLRGPLI